MIDANDQWQCSIAFVNRKQNNKQEQEYINDLVFNKILALKKKKHTHTQQNIKCVP